MYSKQALVLVCAISNILSAAVTINEFHYDNSGGDLGEFVEIVVTDPASMSPADIDVVFYNGGDGKTYKTLNLGDFNAHGILSDSRAYYSALVPGIQNGAPDGIAVTYQGTVSEFISYEGTFSAANGPALGMLSTDILIYEPTSTAVDSSLQRLNFGDEWLLTEGYNTMGQINTGSTPDPEPEPEPVPVPVPGAFLLTCMGLGLLNAGQKQLQ